MNLFTQRALVGIADRQRELSGLLAIKHAADAQMTKLILNELKVEDISYMAVEGMNRAFKTSDPNLRTTFMMIAFWRTFSVHLVPEKLRLVIHGPDHMKFGDQQLITFTGGEFNNRLELANYQGEFPGFFDNITVFRDWDIPYEAVLDRAIPGTTITLVRPNPVKHHFWMAWCGFDPDFSAFLSAADKLFTLTPIDKQVTEDVEVIIFGLEAKLCNSRSGHPESKSRSSNTTSPSSVSR